MEDLRSQTDLILKSLGKSELSEQCWKFWLNNKNSMMFDELEMYRILTNELLYGIKNETFTKFPENTFEINKRKWEGCVDNKPSNKPIIQQATTDIFKCGKCGESKCTYYTAQTRSGDESTTIFIQCTVCDFHWKQ